MEVTCEGAVQVGVVELYFQSHTLTLPLQGVTLGQEMGTWEVLGGHRCWVPEEVYRAWEMSQMNQIHSHSWRNWTETAWAGVVC